MISIRRRLLGILALATGFVWLCGVGWIGFQTRGELDRMLDARLGEVGRMVASMVRSGDIDPMVAARAVSQASGGTELLPRPFISCQIWDAQGRLLGRSGGAPDQEFASIGNGFTDTVVGGHAWRVFGVVDETRGIRILIGDDLDARQDIVRQIMLGLIVPAALLLPLLAGLIWWSVSLGLRPLRVATAALRGRAPGDLAPLPTSSLPDEVRPMFAALDELLEKLAEARAQEQTFTAFAAHELRTPIAGLKLQAQVALASRDEAGRQAALKQIMIAVDRTSAVVNQVLELARLDGQAPPPEQPVDAGGLVHETARRLEPIQCGLTVTRALEGLALRINPEMLSVALRNLMENAVLQTPAGAEVVCDAEIRAREVAIVIADRGPGIPADELEHVRKRFFRGRHRTPRGSGLGLAIAEAAMRRVGGRLSLRNRPEGGVIAELLLPASQLSGPVSRGAELA
ncbi:sensor histidine kinase N-terminal domain-containing protein [Acetobacteraceae bacterium H6797]|nr:sensor histidine kinase N-terminal domain-containing protein [Acetobacteraceae bacterium H6797]